MVFNSLTIVFFFLFSKLVSLLILGGIDLPVYFIGRQQLLMSSYGIDLSALHHNDPVCVLHRSRPLGNNDLGSFRNVILHGLPDPGVCSGIHRTGGVIQNQDFGLFQKSSGNTEPLLLAAGYIGSALFYVSV